ncbi:hypothetical protein ACFE04_004087 [Oxalis oulophora]
MYDSNSRLQSAACPLLTTLDSYVEAHNGQAEEQSRLSLPNCVYALNEEHEDDVVLSVVGAEDDGSNNDNGFLQGFDLMLLYKAYHIHQTLGLGDQLKQYYFENRKLQFTSNFQDMIFTTSGGLITKMEV